MPDESKKESAVRRIRIGLKTLATFARLREELILKRLSMPPGVGSERLEELIRINEETMTETRKILWRAEDELLKEMGGAS